MPKNYLSLTLIFYFIIYTLPAQDFPVYFHEATVPLQDSNFEQVLVDLGHDTDGEVNGQINAQDAANVKELDISSKNISSMEDLIYFQGLGKLDCSDNPFTEINLNGGARIQLKYSTVEYDGLPALNDFTCTNSLIDYFEFYDLPSLSIVNISNNSHLKHIDFQNTPNLSSLEASNSPNLESLILLYAELTNTSFIQNIPQLKNFTVHETAIEDLDLSQILNIERLDLYSTKLTSIDLTQLRNLKSVYLMENQELSYLDLRNGNNASLSLDVNDSPDLSCIYVDDGIAANTGKAPYSEWDIQNHMEFRGQSCDYDITLSSSKMNIAENGEQTILTATLNDISPSEDITVNLKLSGTAASTNYELSSSSIIIPAGQFSTSVTLTALEDAMDSDKTVVIDVLSVENADILSSQELTVTINHVNDAPTDISLVTASFDENLSYEEMTLIEVADIDDVEHTISLVQGEGSSDNDKFTIIDNKLYTDLTFDYETKNEYFIRLKAMDPEGLSTEKAIVISVNNLNDIVISGTIGKTYCGTDTIGFIETAFDEYVEPLTYQWSSGETTRNISKKPSGTYTITVTDGDGMVMSKDFEIGTEPIYNDLTICYVSSDNIDSDYNRIFINNAESYNVDKIQILREGSTLGQYELIGEISPYENSFLDTSSNNQSVSYNYKVRIKDKCGNVSELSPFHQTILLQANKASDGSINLNWSAYSGLNYGTYDIYRKENNNDFELLISLSANNLAYNDKDVSSNTKSYDYFIGITVNDPCNFTLVSKTTNSTALVKSNYKSFASTLGTTIPLNETVSIYPNPVRDSFTVDSKITISKIEIYSLLGRKMALNNTELKNIKISHLKKGIYLLNLHTEKGLITKRIIKK